MAGTKEIKRRINSIKNTKKITKAMELVAASKMKRSVVATLSSRAYAEYSAEILTSVGASANELKHPFFMEQSEGKSLLVLITSNRGLCGGYNSQIIKKTISKIRELGDVNQVELATVGRKGDAAMRRLNLEVTSTWTDMPDVNISLADVNPLAKFIMDEYRITENEEKGSRKYQKIYLAYTHFTSALSQTPRIMQVLPITREELDTYQPKATNSEYLFEGNLSELMNSLAEKITRRQIYQMILESNASEQSARMMAMKNASEASGEMIDDLTLVFNKARQANITREISEISAGMASIS